MEFKGTKGKWKLSGKTKSYPISEIVSSVETDLEIAYVLPKVSGTREANAKLIASAPEMLEMLKDILSGMKNENYEVCQTEIQELIKKATTI